MQLDRKIFSVFSVYAVFFAFLTWPSAWYQPQEDLKVMFLDIGQGDATYIRTPQGKNILIDGGPDKTVLYKLGAYMPWWEKHIDMMFLSHPHADHLTGLLQVLERYAVGTIFITDARLSTPEFRHFEKMTREKNITIEYVKEKKSIDIEPGIRIDIFHPESSAAGVLEKDINNTSILMRLSHEDTSFLFTGDLEVRGQRENLDEGVDSDILKVPHQGSQDSLSTEFISRVTPAISVISVGENQYGHPSKRVIRALERAGSQVFITREYGDIVMISDGKQVLVK